MDEVLIGIAIIFGIIIVVVITWFVALRYQQKIYSEKIGSAEEKSRKIIDEALKVAETKKREARVSRRTCQPSCNLFHLQAALRW